MIERTTVRSHSTRLFLALVLLLTAAVALTWSHIKLLDQDEVFVLQTDSVPSVAQLIHVQRHFPISLDPMVYHLLGHASIKLFGAGAFAVRLPSLLGYLLMQVCLFGIVRRIAGDRAAVVASAVPALTATLFYAAEARPYGLLLGLAALILLAYQHVTRDDHESRAAWLVTLALSIALALNTHYFAVLLMIPLCAAELWRIARTRRIDWPVAIAIVSGMAAFGFALPFYKAAGEFRKHYYNAGRVGLHAITQAYRALFIAYTEYSMRTQHMLMAVLVLFAIALIVAATVRFRSTDILLPSAERVFLLVLAALPFFGFLLARFVTHSIEVRYVLSAIIAIAVLIAIAALPLLRSARSANIVFGVLLLGILAAGVERVREERVKADERLAYLTISPELEEQIVSASDPHLYVQNMGDFDEFGSYVTDTALRSRLSLVYSSGEEIALLHHDTVSLTAEHMRHFTVFPITRYEDLKAQPGPHLMLLYHGGGWNWTDQALQQDRAQITFVGHALHGDVVSVVFP